MSTDLLQELHPFLPEMSIFGLASLDCKNQDVEANSIREVLVTQVSRNHISRLEISNAQVSGELNLSDLTIDAVIQFSDCVFANDINLRQATIPGIAFRRGAFRSVLADRINVAGAFELVGLDVEEVHLSGARICGSVDLRGTYVEPIAKPGIDTPALEADGLRTDGDILFGETTDSPRFGRAFRAKGEVKLNGSKIGRDLICRDATFFNPGGYSLSAAGAHINGSIYIGRSVPSPGRPATCAGNSTGTLHLEGAVVDGNLDAQGGKFVASPFSDSNNTVREHRFEGDLESIRAGGIKVGGYIRFNNIESHGTVWLHCANVRGNFDCTGAQFLFPGETALWADGITIGGDAYFTSWSDGGAGSGSRTDSAKTNGILRFVNAKFELGLNMSNASFETSGKWRGLRTDPPMLGSRLQTREINGDLKQDACGLYAPSAKISGRLWWCGVKVHDGCDKDRQVFLSLLNARADVLHDDLDSWNGLGIIDLRHFEFREISNLDPLKVRDRLRRLDDEYAPLNNSKADIQTDPPAVNKAGSADLHHGLWSLIRHPLEALCRRSAQRLRKIPRKPLVTGRCCLALGHDGVKHSPLRESIQRFNPQPYLQLAKVVRDAGYEAEATKILLRLERNRVRYSGLGRLRQLGHWVHDAAIGKGFSPLRPLWFMLIWGLVSAFVFSSAYKAGRILPTDVNLVAEKHEAPGFSLLPEWRGLKVHVSFNALIYSYDTLVPLIDFNQKRYWVVQPLHQRWGLYRAARLFGPISSVPDYSAGLLAVFNPILGWVMTSFLAAGVAKLIRSTSD
jgi:hypothetical protein